MTDTELDTVSYGDNYDKGEEVEIGTLKTGELFYHRGRNGTGRQGIFTVCDTASPFLRDISGGVHATWMSGVEIGFIALFADSTPVRRVKVVSPLTIEGMIPKELITK